MSDTDFALASQKGKTFPVSVKAQRRKHPLGTHPIEEWEQLCVGSLLSPPKQGWLWGLLPWAARCTGGPAPQLRSQPCRDSACLAGELLGVSSCLAGSGWPLRSDFLGFKIGTLSKTEKVLLSVSCRISLLKFFQGLGRAI